MDFVNKIGFNFWILELIFNFLLSGIKGVKIKRPKFKGLNQKIGIQRIIIYFSLDFIKLFINVLLINIFLLKRFSTKSF